MIFAAGLGKRLKPITDSIPKALVPICGKQLLQLVIERLVKYGFNEIIVNVHHFPDQIIDFLKENNDFGIRIEVSDERDLLLDTGGGVRKAAWFFDDNAPFLIHNVDILSNADLGELYRRHLATNSLATLVVSERDTFRYLLFDQNLRLNGWINEKTGETKPAGLQRTAEHRKLAFSGIQVMSPAVFDLMAGYEPKFPIMDFYLTHAASEIISGFVPADYKMLDVGKLNVIDEAEMFVKSSI